MAQKALGKSHRKGLTLLQVADMFKDEEMAKWFMLHRLHKAFEVEVGPFSSTVEVEKTFIDDVLSRICPEFEGIPLTFTRPKEVFYECSIHYLL